MPEDDRAIGNHRDLVGIGREQEHRGPRARGIGEPRVDRALRADVDAGKRPGMTSEEQAELKRLRKENFELRRANDILQAAASFFGAELDRRHKK